MKISRFIIKIGLVVLPLFCCVSTVLAQRTSYRSIHIGLSPKVSCNSLPSAGLELSAGQYLLNSYWTAGVCATDWNQKVSTSDDETAQHFDHILWNINGGWMYRLVGSYGRWFSLYVGGKAFLGCNQYEVFKQMPNEWEYDFPALEFIYGLEPSIDIEFYLSRHFALNLGVQVPLTFGSSLPSDILHITGSLGIRINL